MTGSVPINEKVIAQDVSIFTMAPITATTGSIGSGQSIVGIAKSAEFTLNKLMVNTTGIFDQGYSERPARFDKGSMSLSGFTLLNANDLNELYAAGTAAFVSIQIGGTGGKEWTFQINMHEFSNSFNENGVDGKIGCNIVGVPNFATISGSLAPAVLNT